MEIALAPPAAASPDGEALASDNLAQVWKKELVHSSRGYGVRHSQPHSHQQTELILPSPLPTPLDLCSLHNRLLLFCCCFYIDIVAVAA